MPSPIAPVLEQRGVLLLDGGLATELEKQGYVLDTALWSAQLLLTHPEAIRAVHQAYLDAGADCITTASYQASLAGFQGFGLSEKEAHALMRKAVTLATEAREAFLEAKDTTNILRPLVAASIGPYGAVLANGAEYRGDYGLTNAQLRDFHEPRWAIMTAAPIDLLACETIPSLQEVAVLLDLLAQTPDQFAWISFSCRDGEHISDGTPIAECAALLNTSEQVAAIGVNCTAPHYITSLIDHIRAVAPDKPIVVYPNSGEVYDGSRRTWVGTDDPWTCSLSAREWYQHGARLIGGCCRVGPHHIAAMREALG